MQLILRPVSDFMVIPLEWKEEFIESYLESYYYVVSDDSLPSSMDIYDYLVHWMYEATSYLEFDDRHAYRNIQDEQEHADFFEHIDNSATDDFLTDVHRLGFELNLSLYNQFEEDFLHLPMTGVW